jgi:hypothetical protein
MWSAPSVGRPNYPKAERRAVPRFIAEHFSPIQVLVKSTFQPFDAHVRDFSARGLGIICDRFLQTGAVVAIQLRQRHTGLSGILAAEVCHCTSMPDGVWLCGCRLSRRLTPDEL